MTLRDVATLQHEPGFNLRELVLTRLIDKILNIAIRDRRAISSRPLLSVWIGIKEDSYGIDGKRGGRGFLPSFLSSPEGAPEYRELVWIGIPLGMGTLD